MRKRASADDVDANEQPPKAGPLHAAMVSHTDPAHLWSIVSPVCVKIGTAQPTREQIIHGYMTIPVLTPTHRDGNGCWQYDVKRLTREEAEAKTDKLLGLVPV